MPLETNLDSHRGNYHRASIEALLRGEKVCPIYIDLSLSKRCSYNCVYCFGKLQRNNIRDLSLETITNFLDDCAEIGVKAISLVSDGESTCNKHLYEAIIYGKSKGIDMALGTNGFLLRQDRLTNILPCLTYLRFNMSAVGEKYATIHGCQTYCFDMVCETIKQAVSIKKEDNLPITIGLQMVLLPEYADQVMPLVHLAHELKVDYLVIKHCSDNESGDLHVDYAKIQALTPLLKEAEARSTEQTKIIIKWSKINTGSNRKYKACWACPLMLQMSGNGGVFPCGSFFGKGYEQYYIGNIADTRFKDLVTSDRYWEVMEYIRSDKFDARTDCATLCLQDRMNSFIYDLQNGDAQFVDNIGKLPYGVNFL